MLCFGLMPVKQNAKGKDGAPSPDGSGQSVERVLDLLEALADHETPASGVRLAELLSLPPATVYRLLTVLSRRGYTRHSRSDRSYSLGPTALILGEASRGMIGSWAEPTLARLADETGESANLALLESYGVVFVAHAASPEYGLRIFPALGRPVPPHSTAVGKILLAYLEPSDARSLLNRIGLAARTERTITDLDQLMGVLPEIRAQGYAIDDEEGEVGVRCLAAPVLLNGKAQGAISISAPRGRLPDEKIQGTVAVLQAASSELTAELTPTAET
jgi:IclR family acetate operon transcriptional repressor